MVSQHHVCQSVLYSQHTRKVQLNSQHFLGHSLSKIQNQTIWKKTPIKTKNQNQTKSVCELLYSYCLIRVLSKRTLETTLWFEHGTPFLHCSPFCPCPPVHVLLPCCCCLQEHTWKRQSWPTLGLEGAALHGILAGTRANPWKQEEEEPGWRCRHFTGVKCCHPAAPALLGTLGSVSLLCAGDTWGDAPQCS